MTRKRTRTADELDDEVERLLEQVRAMKAAAAEAHKKEEAAEREERTHALIVLGALLESAAGGTGMWKVIDFEKVDERLHGADWSAFVIGDPNDMNHVEANRRVREFEKSKREMSKKKPAAETAPTPQQDVQKDTTAEVPTPVDPQPVTERTQTFPWHYSREGQR